MSIGKWFETWTNVFLRPGEVTMEDERAEPQATLGTAMIWLALAALVSGILTWIQATIMARSFAAAGGLQGIINQMGLPPEQMDAMNQALAQMPPGIPFLSAPRPGISTLFASIFFTILAFLFFTAVLQVVAKVLGGTGNYGKYTYLLAAVFIPVTVVNALLGFIPLLGGCLGLLLGIYGLVLSYYATRVEHKLSSGRSIIVILSPVLIGFVLACCGFTLLGGLIASLGMQ